VSVSRLLLQTVSLVQDATRPMTERKGATYRKSSTAILCIR
jgi:hypothetical protein